MVNAGASLPTLTRAQAVLLRDLLQDKTVRKQEGAFVIEGAKSCLDVIRRYPQAVLSLTLSPQYLCSESDKDRSVRVRLPCPQRVCADHTFAKLSDVDTPQGMLAVVRQPQWDHSALVAQARAVGVYGDCVRDPANVGAIIRTAAALNLSAVWFSNDSADHFSPKVVRAAAGTIMAIPVFHVQSIAQLSSQGYEIYAAVVPGAEAVPIRTIRTIPSRLIVAVGNEGAGLSSGVIHAAHLKFAIPIASQVESLNVAAAVAISAFHFGQLPVE